MKRTNRLRPILDRLVEVERQARRRLSAYEAEYATQRARLDDLRRYADEYRQRVQGCSVGIAALREHQKFIGRLEELALAQEGVVETAKVTCYRAREDVERHHRRSEALRRLIARYETRARQESERHDQRTLDDWVSARAGRG